MSELYVPSPARHAQTPRLPGAGDRFPQVSEERGQTDGTGTVVAVVLAWRGRIGLFKRSRLVGHDAGLWHCITGLLGDGDSAHAQALLELFEETGVSAADVVDFRAGPVLELADERGGRWRVHTFRAETTRRKLQLNWEHDAYRWVRPYSVPRFDGQVPWLSDVLATVPGP